MPKVKIIEVHERAYYEESYRDFIQLRTPHLGIWLQMKN